MYTLTSWQHGNFNELVLQENTYIGTLTPNIKIFLSWLGCNFCQIFKEKSRKYTVMDVGFLKSAAMPTWNIIFC